MESILSAGIVLVAVIIILYAYSKKKIDLTAIVATGIMGLMIIFTIEIDYLLVMISFFVLGNLVTKYKYKVKEEQGVAEGVRTFKNVFGNGASATIFALFYFLTKDPWLQFAFVGAMATATADTFATEIGQAHEKNPKLITNFKIVKIGTPGAVSYYGIFGALIGAFLLSLVPWLLGNGMVFLIYGTIAGFIGCFVDSFIGATIERNMIDKHMTNFLATLAGGIFAIGLFLFFPQ